MRCQAKEQWDEQEEPEAHKARDRTNHQPCGMGLGTNKRNMKHTLLLGGHLEANRGGRRADANVPRAEG
jgi:hypothetical protein